MLWIEYLIESLRFFAPPKPHRSCRYLTATYYILHIDPLIIPLLLADLRIVIRRRDKRVRSLL